MPMQELTIKRREGTGKQLAKRLRREGAVPAIVYGGAKNETVTVDPNNNASYTYYDGEGEVTQQVDGRGFKTYAFYDGEGWVTATVDGNNNPDYTIYNPMGWATEHIDRNGVKTFVSYDREGLPTEYIDGTGDHSFKFYDDNGHVAGEEIRESTIRHFHNAAAEEPPQKTCQAKITVWREELWNLIRCLGDVIFEAEARVWLACHQNGQHSDHDQRSHDQIARTPCRALGMAEPFDTAHEEQCARG